MNETYIQTIRGGIQHVIYLAKDHWTQKPKWTNGSRNTVAHSGRRYYTLNRH